MLISISATSAYESLFTQLNLDKDDTYYVDHFIKESAKFGKSNRRMYFLKFLRYRLCQEQGIRLPSVLKDAHLFKTDKKIENVFDDLLHAYEMHNGKIDAYAFEQQPIDVVIAEYERLKTETAGRGLIPISQDDTDEIVNHYPNGFYWVKLNREFCLKEGGAMGHCGNKPSAKTGDRIFSLRKKVKHGRTTYWESKYCTIIQDHGKYLGEIRGRFNSEPEQEILHYVVDLLRNKHLFQGAETDVNYVQESWACLADVCEKDAQLLKKSNPSLVKDLNSFTSRYSKEKGSPITEQVSKFNWATSVNYVYQRKNSLISSFVDLAHYSKADDELYYAVKQLQPKSLVQPVLLNIINDRQFKDAYLNSSMHLACRINLTKEECAESLHKKKLASDAYAVLTDLQFRTIGWYKEMTVQIFNAYQKVFPVKKIHTLAIQSTFTDEDLNSTAVNAEILELNNCNLTRIPDTWIYNSLHFVGSPMKAFAVKHHFDLLKTDNFEMALLNFEQCNNVEYVGKYVEGFKIVRDGNIIKCSATSPFTLRPFTLRPNKELETLPDNLYIEGSLVLENTVVRVLPDNLQVTGYLSLNDNITVIPSTLITKVLYTNDGIQTIEQGASIQELIVGKSLKELPPNMVLKLLNLEGNRLISTLPKSLRVTDTLVALHSISELPEGCKHLKRLGLGYDFDNIPDGIKVDYLYVMYANIRDLPQDLRVKKELVLSDYQYDHFKDNGMLQTFKANNPKCKVKTQ